MRLKFVPAFCRNPLLPGPISHRIPSTILVQEGLLVKKKKSFVRTKQVQDQRWGMKHFVIVAFLMEFDLEVGIKSKSSL